MKGAPAKLLLELYVCLAVVHQRTAEVARQQRKRGAFLYTEKHVTVHVQYMKYFVV